jgi:Plant transposon protein
MDMHDEPITCTRSDRLWSEWVESTRKDVECTFGILKSRWRFLRNGIVLKNQISTGYAFFTCCILHNLILENDGLDNRWETDRDWEILHPQPVPDNSDEGFDDDDEHVQGTQQQTLINARVNQ